MRALLLIALVAAAAGGAVELNEDNFAAEVTDSGPFFHSSNHIYGVHHHAFTTRSASAPAGVRHRS